MIQAAAFNSHTMLPNIFPSLIFVKAIIMYFGCSPHSSNTWPKDKADEGLRCIIGSLESP